MTCSQLKYELHISDSIPFASPDTAPNARAADVRHRGRTGLIQRDLAGRAGVSMRSVQDWEAGLTLPSAERLQALVRGLLEVGGLTPGREISEARALWTAVEGEAPRMQTPFDAEWFTGLLAVQDSPIHTNR
jgi:transcriptional regulator with XRE-family HTH domain